MAGEWNTVPLGELTEIRTGKIDSNQEVNNGNFPFYTCAPKPLRIDHYAFDCDAILLAGNNANGVFHLNRYNGKFNAYQRTYIITLKKRNNLHLVYLFYVLKTLTLRLEEYSQGTATKFLTMKILSALPIPFPPLPVQRAIAHILGTLDDKIELNRRMNETLEEMARAIFKSWFVDFDPVRAKAEGRDTGLPKHIADLFPDEFEESELGRIPKGWVTTNIGKELCIATGYPFKSKLFKESPPGVPLARGDNVKEGEFQWGNKARYWAEVSSDIEQYLLKKGDVLIGMDGSKVGKNWVRVTENDLPCLLVQRVARLRVGSSIGQCFIYNLINNDSFRNYVDAVKTGTSIPHISGNQIKEFNFIRPPRSSNELLHEYERTVAPFIEMHDSNKNEINILSALRNSLLPNLLSGKIQILLGRSSKALNE